MVDNAVVRNDRRSILSESCDGGFGDFKSEFISKCH